MRLGLQDYLVQGPPVVFPHQLPLTGASLLIAVMSFPAMKCAANPRCMLLMPSVAFARQYEQAQSTLCEEHAVLYCILCSLKMPIQLHFFILWIRFLCV